MPLRGRHPSGESRTRHAPVHDWVEVENTRFAGAPKLPAKRPNGKAWSARCKQRWRACSTMPHCALWAESDWSFVFDTLELAARFDEGGATSVAAELRVRERVLGITSDARRSLRIRYVEPKPALTVVSHRRDDFSDL